MDFSQLPLKPLDTPQAIHNWPLAPGWWLLLVSVLLLVCLLYRFIVRYRNSSKRYALLELKAIRDRFSESGDKRWLLHQLNQLLKRSAMSCFGRQVVASLSGDEWVDFLQQKTAAKSDQLQVLARGPYQSEIEYDSEELLKIVDQGLRKMLRGAK